MQKIQVPVILGPTAVGKTECAVNAAVRFGYEILSCDSRQIYRFMNIGTAKPSESQKNKVKHWLIDDLTPDQPYSAFTFAQDALEIIRNLHRCGKKTLICGGTGLYFHTLCSGIGIFSEADVQTRALLQHRAISGGTGLLHNELRNADPEAASRIHPHDLQRIIRALDIFYQTGRPISSLQKSTNPPGDIEFVVFVLDCPRDILYNRINARVEGMFKDGLWEEFIKLRELGYHQASPGMQCVGYKELFAVESGETDLGKASELIKQNTRRYAKRQMTWFRNKTQGVHIDSSVASQKLMDWFVSGSLPGAEAHTPDSQCL